MEPGVEGGTSPLVQAMHALRESVLGSWALAARATLNKARRLPQPILLNTLPAFYDSLTQVLTGPDAAMDVSTLAQEHGGERARLSGYDTTALIDEFQIFRRVLFDELHAAAVPFSHQERQILDGAIDGAIRESVAAFALIQSALREQFVAAITHDIRTPLSNASIAAHLIEARLTDEPLKMLARKILENTARIDAMTRDLLDCIVFNSGEHLPLHITAFDMADLVNELAGPGITMAVTSIPGYWCRDSVKRALENLINNAVKYGTAGEPIRLVLHAEKGRVQVSVHNDGDPIPQEELESIFQVYRRAQAAKGKHDGWGVGLPYARRVAESHGGSIIVTSNTDYGTTFTLDIPIDARPFEGAPSLA